PKMLLLLLPLLWTGSLAQDNAFRLQMNKSVTVQEGLCILVPCSVFYPRRGWIDSDPARGYWFRNESNYFSDAPVATNDAGRKVREETKGRFHLVGDPRDYNCSLDIRDARMADKGSYFFRIVRGSYVLYNFNHYQLYVHVTALTQTPNIHIQGTLESGHPTNITCKVPWACKRGMPPTFFWIGVAVTSLGSKTPNSSELTFTPEPHHHGTNLTCRVTFPGAGVATESTIQLNVSYAPQNMTISVFWENGTDFATISSSSNISSCQSLCLACVSSSNPPAWLSWEWGSLTLSSSHPLNPGVLSLNLSLELSSGLRLSYDAQNAHGNQSVTLLLLPGEPRTWSGIAQGASWGAGITALLTLSFCLIFFTVKIYKKKRAEAAATLQSPRPVTWDISSPPSSPSSPRASNSHYPSSEAAAPTLSDEQELHYASVSFQGPRPWNSQGQEVTNTTEYSEIKI
uniref:Ig-like domain-containing protein n=1 Tax=Loxodonta africana TaxID=9785 RepID=G3STB8_LOXAF